jgi:hypothetical protein
MGGGGAFRGAAIDLQKIRAENGEMLMGIDKTGD